MRKLVNHLHTYLENYFLQKEAKKNSVLVTAKQKH